jgi:hypothetical protein
MWLEGPKVRVASASPADRVSRLSAIIEARVQQLPNKYNRRKHFH